VTDAVGGLDGCRGGWVLAILPATSVVLPAATVELIGHFADAAALVRAGHLAALAVDMPIGLPDGPTRAADREARAQLGVRRSSVFPTPVRAVLGATSYPEALEISRRVAGVGLSRQAFNLLPRMREVDGVVDPADQERIVECHPELAFARLAGRPLPEPKRTSAGRAERLDLLEPFAAGAAGLAPPRGARPDDVLDALVLATVAARVATGAIGRLGDGARDARGLRMEIVV
jgi:predicted RNase H-like nuclease